jgi:anti-sigma B factor antagonist
MTTATRTSKGTLIVDVSGNIDFGNSRTLRKTLLESLKETDRLAVNLIAVKYIDSSGLASLLEVLKEARNTQRKLLLFGLTVAVREVLQLTRLNGVFEIHETEDEVLNASDGKDAR